MLDFLRCVLLVQQLHWVLGFTPLALALQAAADGYIATVRKLMALGPEGEQHLAKGIYLLCQRIREKEKERIREERGSDQSAIANPVSRGQRMQERNRRRNEGGGRQGNGRHSNRSRNRSRNRNRNRS